MEKQTDIYFIKLVQDAVTSLDKIDDLINTNGERLSKIDSEISDMLHLLETEVFNNEQSLKFTNKLKDLREQRRSLRIEFELGRTFNNIRSRLAYKVPRQEIGKEIMNCYKGQTYPYKNRVLTENDLKDLLDCDKIVIKEDEPSKKRKRRTKEELEILKKEVKERLENQKKIKEIAEEFGISVVYVKLLKKELEDK